jgi:hypothetical protein
MKVDLKDAYPFWGIATDQNELTMDNYRSAPLLFLTEDEACMAAFPLVGTRVVKVFVVVEDEA